MEMSSSTQRVSKDEATGERAMVASEHPLATAAGLEVLRRGGNAVDAAVTMSFAMGVLQPSGSGIGGGGLMVLHRAASRQTLVLDFAMDAPLAATPDAYELEDQAGPSRFRWRKVKDDANMLGHRAAAVPGQVRGLALALARFGTLPLSETLAPAIRLAEQGFEVDGRLALQVVDAIPLLARFPASAAVYLPGGYPLRAASGHAPADRLVQADLARILRLLAVHGPDAFYQGPIARAIVDEMRAHGGLIAEEDLARYQPTIWEGGLAIHYRGHLVVGDPGACGSDTALHCLKLLEQLHPSIVAAGGADAAHLRAEAYRRAFADRSRYAGDPKQVPVPWRGLLSDGYAHERARGIDPTRAAPAVEPGDPWRFEPSSAYPAPHAASAPHTRGSSTTHLCAVDAERNVVSLTQTIVDGFGCGVVVPGTGVVLNNAMLWLDPEPGRPNSVAPGKRGHNNMTPLIVLRGGRPLLAVGAPGGARIINGMSEVVSNVLDRGLGIQAAIEAPRLDASGPELLLDSRFPDNVRASLAARGHHLQVVEESFHAAHFSTPLGILIDPERGTLRGGVDPFRISVAAGF
jgi:gamma-glutamyltranspeptidase/glutathione hydrolase